MDSQRIVFIEESHHCPECDRLVCRMTKGNGESEHTDCSCDEFQKEDTEIIYLNLLSLNYGENNV